MTADIQEALSLQSQGRLDEAKNIYLEFLEEMPEQPDVSNLLGLIYLQQQNLDEAQKCFEIAVKGFPCAEFHQNLGLALYKKKEYRRAMENFEKAIEFESENQELIRNCAQLAKLAAKPDTTTAAENAADAPKPVDYAVKFFEKALALEPNDSVGWNNLGLLYEQIHDYKKAKACYVKSLKCEENYEAAHNLGVLYRTLRNFDESIRCLTQALKLIQKLDNRKDFDHRRNETMISLGMSYLSKKDLQNGYKYYKFLKPEIKAQYENPKENKFHWDGKNHKNGHSNSTLFVFYYAGYGDHIMFSRYLPYLKNHFKNVKVWLPPSVRGLIEKNFDGIEFVESANVDYDYSANIMELHFLLNMDFDHIPSSNGYLKADSEKVQDYCEKYFSTGNLKTNRRKIGLFWQGNPKVFPNRSIRLKELESLLSLENTEFYSFEKEDEHNQIKAYPQIINLGETFNNFSDTAAALMNIDVLVTIDSAIAHLAGALGVKTFLLLPYSSEWRWFSDTKSTPWYDTVKIFKQKEPWNWQDAVEEVCEELKKSD